MHVPIDDQHAIELMLVASDAGRDGDVVEQAEAHRPLGERMMAGRPHEAQRRLRFAREHAIDRIARRAGGQLGHVERRGADDRVRIDVPAAARGQRRDAIDVSRFVDAFEPRRETPAPTSAARSCAARPVDSNRAMICRSRSGCSGWWPVSWSRNRGS